MADSEAHRVAQAPELPPALPPRAEEGAIYARCSGRRDVSRTVDYDLPRATRTHESLARTDERAAAEAVAELQQSLAASREASEDAASSVY